MRSTTNQNQGHQMRQSIIFIVTLFLSHCHGSSSWSVRDVSHSTVIPHSKIVDVKLSHTHLHNNNTSTNASNNTSHLRRLASSNSCSSVILLSPGRTATDTVSHTVVESSPLKYCDNMKEYYGHGRIPQASTLKSCYDRHVGKGGVYIHVKPEHIMLGSKYKGHGYLMTPGEFFHAAKKIGFYLVVTSFRDNQLAREISSFEMFAGSRGSSSFNSKARAIFVKQNLTKVFEDKVRLFNRAVVAARHNGFQMVSITFLDIVTDLCKTSEVITDKANCPAFHCHKESGHTDQSHHDRSMSGRVGSEAGYWIKKQLTATPYEWMLDLKAAEWPKDIKRPIKPLD
jgi:hypothetical protein